MKHDHALRQIAALADGIDPTSGEVLPTTSCVQQPDVIRALNMARLAMESTHRRMLNDLMRPVNAGLPWTPEDDEQLREAHEGGASLPKLCEQFQRTRGAIQARLEKLGLGTAPTSPTA